MAYPVHTIRTPLLSLGGTYTASTVDLLATRPGRTYRMGLLNHDGVGTLNFGVSYNGGACDGGCDAWYTGPTRDYLAPAAAWSIRPVGRNNGGNLGFDDYTLQDVTDDGDGLTLVQSVRAQGSATLPFAAAAAGSLLVLTVFSSTSTDALDPPAGWSVGTPRTANGIFGIAARTLWRIADGGEVAVTVSGLTAATADLLLREFAAGALVGPGLLLDAYQESNQVNFAYASTPPAGAALMVGSLLIHNGDKKYVDDAAGVAHPWPIDYVDSLANQPRLITGFHLAAPAGELAGAVQPSGGSTWGVLDLLYFGGSPAFVPRFW